MKQIYLLAQYDNHSVGDIIEISDKVAKDLIDSKIARPARTKDFLIKPEFGTAKALGRAPRKGNFTRHKK